MREYFDKYKSFERVSSNKTIDDPVIFLWKATFQELVVGFVAFVVGIYGFGISKVLGIFGLGLAALLPALLRWRREHLPENTFAQIAWHLGLMNGSLPQHMKRPATYYLEP